MKHPCLLPVVCALVSFAGPPPVSGAVLAESRSNCQTVDLRSREAVPACTAAIKRRPTDTSLFVRRGIAWTNMGQEDFAIADFSRAILRDPNNGMAIYMRGLAREKKGYLQQSQEDLRRCIELNVFMTDARAAIKRVETALGSAQTADRGMGEAGAHTPAPEIPATQKVGTVSSPHPTFFQDIDHGGSTAVFSSSETVQSGRTKGGAEGVFSRFSIMGVLAVLNAVVIWLVARGSRVQYGRRSY